MSNKIPFSRTPIAEPKDSNRAMDIRRDTDIFNIPSITIYDIDFAVLWHLQNKIRPQITDNGRIIDVPIIMDNGEKWSQIQDFGFLRDKDGKVQSPLITLRRTTFIADDRIPKLDLPNISSTNDAGDINSNNVLIYTSNRQKNNQYDFLNELQNTKKSIEYYVTVLPEHVRVSYELMIWTDMVEQCNKIIELMWPQSRCPWGDSLTFTTYVLDPTFEVVNTLGEDRLVRCTVGLETAGQIQQQYELRQSNIRKAYSNKRIVFQNDRSQYDINVDKDFPN